MSELLHVVERRVAIAEDAHRLVAHAPFDVEVLRQEVERPRQQVRRRLVARQDHRDDLVAELLVGRALPGVLVDGLHEHAEEVIAVRLGAALGDEPIDEGVERLHRLLETQVRGRRHGGRDANERLGVVVRPVHRDVHRVAYRARLALDVRREQRQADDAERDAHHLSMDVERLGRLFLPPRVEVIPRRARHVVGEGGELAAVIARAGTISGCASSSATASC